MIAAGRAHASVLAICALLVPACGGKQGGGTKPGFTTRFARAVVPFEWDIAGSERKHTQLIAVAATRKHVVVIYPPAGQAGTHIAWAGIDSPWQAEPLSDLGLDRAVAVDAATGPDDTVHVVFLTYRQAGDNTVGHHVAWRAGEGVVARTSFTGAEPRQMHLDFSRPDLGVGVRRSGEVDAVYTLNDQQRFSGRNVRDVYLATQAPGASEWQTTLAFGPSLIDSVDVLDLGQHPRIAYDALDRPVISFWWANETTNLWIGPQQLVMGDDGLYSPAIGSLANRQALGSRILEGIGAQYAGGYADTVVDPDYGWMYLTPLGGRARGLSADPAGIAMRSISPIVSLDTEPHATRSDLMMPLMVNRWVGGRLFMDACKGVRTMFEPSGNALVDAASTSRGDADCWHSPRAPMFQVLDDPDIAAAGPVQLATLPADPADPFAILVRYQGRAVFAHGHRPFDVGVTPRSRLYVNAGTWFEPTARGVPTPWPADDLLHITGSTPADGAPGVPVDSVIRIQIAGATGARDRIAVALTDLSSGQDVFDTTLAQSAEGELVITPGRPLAPGIKYRLALQVDGPVGGKRLYPWQYEDRTPPVLRFETAGAPPMGARAPDARGTPLELDCPFCEPAPTERLSHVPPRAPERPAPLIRVKPFLEDWVDAIRVQLDITVRTTAGAIVAARVEITLTGEIILGWSDGALQPDTEYDIVFPPHFRTMLGRRLPESGRALRFRTAAAP